jgi:ATP-binding cassette subfamily C (CFTR/MRP) protein 1
MVALYRMVELTSGSISLDGVDISEIGLHALRSCIASECVNSYDDLT